jgi:hypothetical protein
LCKIHIRKGSWDVSVTKFAEYSNSKETASAQLPILIHGKEKNNRNLYRYKAILYLPFNQQRYYVV